MTELDYEIEEFEHAWPMLVHNALRGLGRRLRMYLPLPPLQILETWTPEQLDAVYHWALARYWHAKDGDVKGIPQPPTVLSHKPCEVCSRLTHRVELRGGMGKCSRCRRLAKAKALGPHAPFAYAHAGGQCLECRHPTTPPYHYRDCNAVD